MYIVTPAPEHSTSSSISSTLPSQLHKDNWNMPKFHVHYITIQGEVFVYSSFHEQLLLIPTLNAYACGHCPIDNFAIGLQ
jgi:hypothetical protein